MLNFRLLSASLLQISKHLASLLKLLYNKGHTVKNSKEFVDFVTTQRIEKDEQIVSFDVTSLFTSIPVDLALEIVNIVNTNKS